MSQHQGTDIPHQVRPPGPPNRKSAATAHLCAAAYLDRTFRDTVVDEVYNRTDRAVAPNPGADAVPILEHVLRARNLDAAQQGLMAGLLLVTMCLAFTNTGMLFTLLIGIVVWLAVGMVALAIEAAVSSSPTMRRLRAGMGRRVGKGGQTVLLAVGGIIALMVISQLLSAPSTTTLDGGFGSDYGTEPDSGGGVAAFFLFLLGAVTATFGALRANGLASVPTETGSERPSDDRIRYIGEAQSAPVVNYHAARKPFVGSGYEVTTWQFAMTLQPATAGDGASRPISVDPTELNRHVRERIQSLGTDSAITSRLPDLELSDQVYISGRDTAQPVRYPDELPASGYPFDSVERIQRDPTTPARHYLRCQVSSWEGELVTTIFVHCALQGESLYTEFSGFILPPTREQYHVFGRGAASREATVFMGLLRGAAMMPIELVRSPFDSIRNIVRAVRAPGNGDTPRQDTEDVGAIVGIRELGTDTDEQNYFQYRDSVKYLGILERQILEALTGYLRDHGVDTSELAERATAIINHGTINYGKITAGAVGAGASANVGAVGTGATGSAGGGHS